MNIKQTYQIYKDGKFKDEDMRRLFERKIRPQVVAELIEEIDALYEFTEVLLTKLGGH